MVFLSLEELLAGQEMAGNSRPEDMLVDKKLKLETRTTMRINSWSTLIV